MAEQQPSGAQRQFGQIAPFFAEMTDDVLSARDRSLVTVAALVAGGNTEQLRFHLPHAVENGVTRTELIEAITHLAFYTGWPRAVSAISIAKEVLDDAGDAAS